LTNSQLAIRTNDIENIGITSRHHSIFEMLGNFSIGDYFKEQAIEMAYELLFKVFSFEINKIFITVYNEDEVTYKK
jgi:alanyl-tRNA synthetase